MQPIDFFTPSSNSVADVEHLRQRVQELSRTVTEQQRTIELLQEENRSCRTADAVECRELRRQLSENENMRALMSDELQRFRAQVGAMVILAAGAIREEMLAMEELSDRGYLNITGHARLDELKQWLKEYENQ